MGRLTCPTETSNGLSSANYTRTGGITSTTGHVTWIQNRYNADFENELDFYRIVWNTLWYTSKQSMNKASNFQISQTSNYFPSVSIWIEFNSQRLLVFDFLKLQVLVLTKIISKLLNPNPSDTTPMLWRNANFNYCTHKASKLQNNKQDLAKLHLSDLSLFNFFPYEYTTKLLKTES